jgi:hypothetical protein
MKPLIALLAVILGCASVGVVLTIQRNPLAFTRLDGHELAPASLKAPSLPGVSDIMDASEPSGRIVQIAEVRIVGRVFRPSPPVQDAIEHRVVPAPCRDGEYRLIDAVRGVRLMCPGGSLE